MEKVMIFEKLQSILSVQFNVDKNDISFDTDFFKDLNADSLDIIDLVSTISGEFDLDFDENKISNFKTVGDVVKYIEENTEN
jgi:acyl carrier protein